MLTFAPPTITPRGVAQLAARHVRDVEVGSSSLLTPTFAGLALRAKPAVFCTLATLKRVAICSIHRQRH